jgi:hypothetical protein
VDLAFSAPGCVLCGAAGGTHFIDLSPQLCDLGP